MPAVHDVDENPSWWAAARSAAARFFNKRAHRTIRGKLRKTSGFVESALHNFYARRPLA
jgi:hypothetical protein